MNTAIELLEGRIRQLLVFNGQLQAENSRLALENQRLRAAQVQPAPEPPARRWPGPVCDDFRLRPGQGQNEISDCAMCGQKRWEHPR